MVNVQKERAMELLAVKWGCMTEEEKAPYYEKAKEVKETYFTKVQSLCSAVIMLSIGIK